MGAALWSAEAANDHTTDEPGHLTRGVAWWQADDLRLSWPHPPLGQVLATAPVAALADETVEFSELRGWKKADFSRLTHHYWEDYAAAREQLKIARLAMALLSILLAIYLYEWTRERGGERLALFTTIAYAANPVLLAHAGLMTTDFPIAGFTLVAVLQTRDYLVDRSWWRVAYLAAAVAAMVTTKHSGILLGLALLVPGIVWAARGRGRFEGLGAGRRAGSLARDAGVVLLVALLAVNLVYRFEDTGLTTRDLVDHREPKSWLKKQVVEEIDGMPEGLRVPLPFNYYFSAQFIRAQNKRGHGGFWRGQPRGHVGVPGYFPIMLGIKLPTGLLALLLAGLALALRRRLRDLPLDVWLHAYVIAFFVAVTFDAQINIGVRHALPVVPSLACLAGRGANALWRAHPIGRWLAGACLSSMVAGVALAHPRYIGDFNWLVGGREGGHEVSVIGEDWGQEVGELARWQEQQGVPVRYQTAYGLRRAALRSMDSPIQKLICEHEPPADAWVAIHLTRYVRRSRCIPFHVDRLPDVVLNDHILLFKPEAELTAEELEAFDARKLATRERLARMFATRRELRKLEAQAREALGLAPEPKKSKSKKPKPKRAPRKSERASVVGSRASTDP